MWDFSEMYRHLVASVVTVDSIGQEINDIAELIHNSCATVIYKMFK